MFLPDIKRDGSSYMSKVLIYVNLAWQTIYSLPRFLLFIFIHVIIYDCIIMIQTD